MHRVRCGERAWGFCATVRMATLPGPAPPSPSQKLSESSQSSRGSRRLRYIGTMDWLIGPWLIPPAASPHPEVRGSESSNPLTTWLVLPATSPRPWVESKNHLNTTKDTFIILITGNPKGFRSGDQELWMIGEIYIWSSERLNIDFLQICNTQAFLLKKKKEVQSASFFSIFFCSILDVPVCSIVLFI